MAKKNNNLPAYTTAENLLLLIEVLKKNNKNEETVKALFGMGDNSYSNTKSALKTFDIIESKTLEFTVFGRKVAFASDDNKKEELVPMVKSYEPYKLVIDSISTTRDETNITSKDTIKNLWGRAEFGTTDRNRDEGATLFMSLMNFIEFGIYIKRGKGGPRIEWANDIESKIIDFNNEESISINEEQIVSEMDEELSPSAENEIDINSSGPSIVRKIDNKDEVNYIESQANIVSLPNITINVDMASWTDEKIKTFFRYAYGKFEEE